MYVVPLLLLFQLPQSSFHSGSHATLDSVLCVFHGAWLVWRNGQICIMLLRQYMFVTIVHANIPSYLQTKF